LNGDTPDKTLTYAEMSNNLMMGRIACSNEDIRRILASCFKKDHKDRFSPSQLLEAVNAEISKLEQLKPSFRPQNMKTTQGHSHKMSGSLIPLSPSEVKGKNNHSNRFMPSDTP
jgi:hypothetical protein